MLYNLTMVVGLAAVSYQIAEYMEMMKTALMKKLMMNLMKMMMMNLMETRMFKLMDMYHPSKFSTKFWRMSKGYMSLPMQHLVIYRITQMLRNQMSHPLFITTYQQHLNLNML